MNGQALEPKALGLLERAIPGPKHGLSPVTEALSWVWSSLVPETIHGATTGIARSQCLEPAVP